MIEGLKRPANGGKNTQQKVDSLGEENSYIYKLRHTTTRQKFWYDPLIFEKSLDDYVSENWEVRRIRKRDEKAFIVFLKELLPVVINTIKTILPKKENQVETDTRPPDTSSVKLDAIAIT